MPMDMNTIIEEDRSFLVQVYNPERVTVVRGDNVFLVDVDGKQYLDFSGQFAACSLGHGNRELIDALRDQMDRLVCVTPMFVTKERVALAKALCQVTPKGLTRCLFGCTGSDANEFALKAAKYYRGGGKIVSFWRGYHGATAGAAAATGKAETIQVDPRIAELLPRGFIHVSPPYCYRCDFGRSYPDCDLFCLKFLETQIHHEGEDHIAALIIEPILAAGGVIVPPKGYLPALRRLCDKYAILLIFDEVVTGIGRTGTMFACEHWGVTPDILVIGKALTGGYVPGSAVIVRQDIGAALDKLVLHGHTHSGYPLMCAAARKNLEIIQRDHLCDHVRDVGEYLMKRLRELRDEFPVIGDIRGIGLLQGIEIVKDRDTKEPDHALGLALFKDFLSKGLVTELESRANLNNCVIVLHPPLITQKDHVDAAVDIMRRSLQDCLGNKRS